MSSVFNMVRTTTRKEKQFLYRPVVTPYVSRERPRRHENLLLWSACWIRMTLGCTTYRARSVSCNILIHFRKENQLKQQKKEELQKEKAVRRVWAPLSALWIPKTKLPYSSAPVASSLFLAHNTALAPPYRVLIDTNFINFSLQNKLELVSGMMDCLYAKCVCFLVSGGGVERELLIHTSSSLP